MEPILIGTTDRTVAIFIPDPASTTGAGKTGLVAASLTVTYTRIETDNDVTHTDVTSSLNNLSALTDAHNDWGLKEVSSTLSKGLYRLDIADAVFASGAWYAVVQVTITSGTASATPIGFRLVAYNELDGVRMGLTALPNAAAEASGGLFTRGTGAGQINQTNNGQIDANAARLGGTTQTGRDIGASVLLSSGTGAGQIDFTLGIVNANIRKIYDVEMPANIAYQFFQGIYDSGKSTDEVANAFANVFAYYSDNSNVLPPVASVAGAVGSVTGNVGGNVQGTVTLADASLTTAKLGTFVLAKTTNITGFNDLSAAQVNAEADTALADYDAPTNAEMVARTLAAASYATAANQVAIQGATFDTATDSLEAIRNRGDAAWITATGFSTLTGADIRAAIGLNSANLDIQLGDIPTVSEFNARTILSAEYATATALGVVDGIVDDIKAVTVKLDTMLVLDGVVYQYTANSHELIVASSSGPGTADQATSLKILKAVGGGGS